MSQAFNQVVDGAKGAFDDLSKSSNPLVNIMSNLTEKVTGLVAKNENLGTSFFNLNQTVNKTNESLSKTTTEAAKTTMKEPPKIEGPKGPETTSSNEINFKSPLKIEISLSGLLPGMSESEIIKLFQEGKLNEVVSKAVADAAKMRTSEVPEKK